jgi:hypothetical protein
MDGYTSISFAGNNLQLSPIFTSDIKHESAPTKQAIPYMIAHGNGSVIPFTEYSSKMISIQGTINGFGSIVAMDAALDLFRGYLTGSGQNLDIGYNGSIRRYIATVTDIQIDRPGGLAYANFTVTFMATQAFGQDIATTTALNILASTSGSINSAITVNGSAPQQLMVATFTFHTLTTTGTQSVSWGNNNNGQQIIVTRAWTAGDVLQIDCVNRVCTVNGIIVDYTGAFIELPPGAQSLGYSDGFTARNFDYNVVYYVRYL